MCDDLPTADYGSWGWHPCTPMLGLWFLHQEQARRLDVQLPRAGNQVSNPTGLYRDNTGTLRVAAGEAAPETMPLPIQNRILECPTREN